MMSEKYWQIAGKHFFPYGRNRKNFVGDKKNVVLRAESANFLQELNRVNDSCRRALKQGLDDDGGDFVGAFGQQVFQLLDAFDVARFALQADGATIAIGRVNPMHRIPHGLERLRERAIRR